MGGDHTYQINENSAVNEDHLLFFELLGKVLLFDQQFTPTTQHAVPACADFLALRR